MALVLVVIMLGAVLYIIWTILNYTSFVSENVPAVSRLRKRSESLMEGIDNEEKLGEMIQDQVEQEMVYLSKLKVEIGETKQKMQAAKAKTDKLEFQVHKKGKVLPGEQL